MSDLIRFRTPEGHWCWGHVLRETPEDITIRYTWPDDLERPWPYLGVSGRELVTTTIHRSAVEVEYE